MLASCEAEASDPCRTRIAYVVDVGDLGDQGFTASGWNGVLRAAAALELPDECLRSVVTNSPDPEVWGARIDEVVEEGFDIVVTSSFTMGEGTRAAAMRHPDVSFIGTDQFQESTIPNVAGVVFHEDVGGFLAGALAGLVTETGVVGAVLGCRFVPPVSRFGIGFWNGARYVNPDVTVLATFHEDDIATCFTNPTWGAATAEQMIDMRADVVFGAAGGTGNAALIAACMRDVTVIGVDFDQYQTLPEVRECIVSSSTKSIVSAVADLIADADRGALQAGNYFGGSALAPFHDLAHLVSAENATRLEDIRLQLEAGMLDPCAPVPELGVANDMAFCTSIAP
ncbi:BMP family ABC transporter substrate-binding protein [Sandaracinus amylolyticus]|uniref:BMP family ABC transporter substrate-binding protein n=1 Tax=Sandaracinus amylolyticus TaxID=927083 RepID=UPI001F490589|nr:BMP family ABC transporter substrate-binding protein [Sandaracinus amylolyticus]